MNMEIENARWVFVMVQYPGADEQILGQIDEEKQVNFIPAFLSKDSAQQAAMFIPKQRGKKIEIQAIIFEDLLRYANDNGFLIFILDEDGKILQQIGIKA